VFVSPEGVVDAAAVQLARHAFGSGCAVVTSDGHVIERIRAEIMTSAAEEQAGLSPLEILRAPVDGNRPLTINEKY